MAFGYDSSDSVIGFRSVQDFKTMVTSAHNSWIRALLLTVMGVTILAGFSGFARAQSETENNPSEQAGTMVGSSTTAGSPVIEDSDYAVGLRSLEEKVNDLKEKVFRSKARLVLLRETVLNGVISGSRAVIKHRNEMGASFTLISASYALDGEPLFSQVDDDGDLDGRSEIDLFEGSIVPGTHNLSVRLVYRGNGYGVFTYLRDYKFTIKASYPFTAEEGKVVSIKAVAYEKGGLTTDLQERPSVRFETQVKQDVASLSSNEAEDGEQDSGGEETAP